ncbi:MAG: hypothetical protein MJ175_08655, partial [Clostridia bacterium]|nr:hypothetical protein [Clostridia bacterium]
MKQTKMTAETLMRGLDAVNPAWIHDAGNEEALRLAAENSRRKREQKHFVGYELKKLLGVRYLWVFLLILLILNSVTAWFTAGNTHAAMEPADQIAEFFEKYREDPAGIDAHYQEMQAFRKEQERLLSEAIRAGNYDFKMETLPDLYSDVDSYPDSMLFEKLYATLEAAENYPSQLDTVIARAKQNLSSLSYMGIREDAFSYRYQERVIDLYERMRDTVTIQAEYTRGWQEYFSYETVNLFLFFMLIMLASLIFAGEGQSGFLPVMRTTKNGRARTAAAKVLTMLFLSCVFTLLFTISTFAVFGLRIGYSSPDNAIQALSAFTYSPYRITIGAFFWITLGLRMLTAAVFSRLLLLLSVFFYHYVLIYFAGLFVFGINFLLYSIRYVDANNLFRNLNLMTASAVMPLFERYRAMNFFGEVIGFVPVMEILFPCLLLLCSGGVIFFFAKGTRIVRIGWADALISALMTVSAKLRGMRLGGTAKREHRVLRARYYSSSLFFAECYKTLISSRFWIPVLIILCVKMWYAAQISAPVKSYADAVYHEYMTTMEGELTDEKLAYLESERAAITETLSRRETMMESYLNEEISFEEYHKYLSDYNYAYSRDELLRVIEDHAGYLEQKAAETGVQGWFVYDTGWNKLYQGDADLFLYVSLLLLFVGSFAAEYVQKS